MAKLYLTADKWCAIQIRNLITIDSSCGLMQAGYRMPTTNEYEKKAVDIVINYAKNNIKELLKSCELFSKISSRELDEEIEANSQCFTIGATLGMCCVLAKNTEIVLAELQRLDKCQTIQKALQEAIKSGKHLLLII